MQELERQSLSRVNWFSKQTCASLIVTKAGQLKWRFTVDLRPINWSSNLFQFPMPRVEIELSKTAWSSFFENSDCSQNYCQFPLHSGWQECWSLDTPDSLCATTRVQHGTNSAMLHVELLLTMQFPISLKPCTLLWVDDCLFHVLNIKGLLDDICKSLSFCVDYSWKSYSNRCVVFANCVRWCERWVYKICERDQLRRINFEEHLKMPTETTGDQLRQFLCSMQWIRSSISNFQRLLEPLDRFLENIYDLADKCTKRTTSKGPPLQLG